MDLKKWRSLRDEKEKGRGTRMSYPSYYFVVGPGIVVCPGVKFFSDPGETSDG